MDERLTIGELAHRTGLAPSALRYYEELGLLQFAGLPSDGDIDWAAMEAPMPTLREQPKLSQIDELRGDRQRVAS